jgi:hypothetical protein
MLHGQKLGTHLGVDLRTDEDRKMWKLLQDHRAMMDWIAVPNFLAARPRNGDACSTSPIDEIPPGPPPP